MKSFILPRLDYEITCKITPPQIHQILSIAFEVTDKRVSWIKPFTNDESSSYMGADLYFRIDKECFSGKRNVLSTITIGEIKQQNDTTSVISIQSDGFSTATQFGFGFICFSVFALILCAIIDFIQTSGQLKDQLTLLFFATVVALPALWLKVLLKSFLVSIQNRMVSALEQAEAFQLNERIPS